VYDLALRFAEHLGCRHLLDVQQPRIFNEMGDVLVQFRRGYVKGEDIEHAVRRKLGEVEEQVMLRPHQGVPIRGRVSETFGSLKLERKEASGRVELYKEVHSLLTLLTLSQTAKICSWHTPAIAEDVQEFGSNVQFKGLLRNLHVQAPIALRQNGLRATGRLTCCITRGP
jgi:hypothetical protein